MVVRVVGSEVLGVVVDGAAQAPRRISTLDTSRNAAFPAIFKLLVFIFAP